MPVEPESPKTIDIYHNRAASEMTRNELHYAVEFLRIENHNLSVKRHNCNRCPQLMSELRRVRSDYEDTMKKLRDKIKELKSP